MGICALVGAVDFNSEHFKAQKFDYVIAVDAGYRHLEAIDVEPDLIIGDFDSLGFTPEDTRVKCFPVQKDAADIEIALYEAYELGFRKLFVYGCLGGRHDFNYALTQLLTHFAESGCEVFSIGADVIITALCGGKVDSLEFDGEAQGTISVFSASEKSYGIDEVGLEYLLDQATLANDKPLGVSNSFVGRKSKISVRQGTILVFFPCDAWSSRYACAR